MSKSAFIFFKGLGLLFAILIGIGIAVLGWYDNSDWINIAFYSLASTALVLWGWYHFSIKWIHIDLKENIFSHTAINQIENKKSIDEETEETNEGNFFFDLITENKLVVIGSLLVIGIFIFCSFVFGLKKNVKKYFLLNQYVSI